jgi:NADP-dependent alcohol dehydrogenase
MRKFRLYNPTDIRFGEGQIEALNELLPADARVLLLYGGGSIKANGVYQAVLAGLDGRFVCEFEGVEPNPVYETLQKAAGVVKDKALDYIIGVGGGSVIDAAKFLAYLATSNADDPWDDLVSGRFPERMIPVGAILTLPATGSESNAVSVITNRTRRLKIPFASESARPAFAILDPTAMRSLDRRQLENGVVDAMTHVLEQYMTYQQNAPIQYGYAETLMRVLVEWGPKLVDEPSDEARENVMFAANQALNGFLGAGLPQDWSTHMIGHAITAIYDIDHARTLSTIMPSVMRLRIGPKRAMLARLARNVFLSAEISDEKAADFAISRLEQFFARMGCPVKLREYGVAVDADEIADHLERASQTALGEHADIDPQTVREIIALAM